MIKKIQNTPKMKASNRKKWADKNKQTQATKVDKWWKKEEHGASGSEDNHSKLIDNRKTWGQSDRIRTVKGKRKKKTFKKLLNKQGKILFYSQTFNDIYIYIYFFSQMTTKLEIREMREKSEVLSESLLVDFERR